MILVKEANGGIDFGKGQVELDVSYKYVHNTDEHGYVKEPPQTLEGFWLAQGIPTGYVKGAKEPEFCGKEFGGDNRLGGGEAGKKNPTQVNQNEDRKRVVYDFLSNLAVATRY